MNKHASKGAEPCSIQRERRRSLTSPPGRDEGQWGRVVGWFPGRDSRHVRAQPLRRMEDLGESGFGNLDRAGALAPGIPFKRERVLSPSHHRVRGGLACGSKAMARPFRSSPGDHVTLRYEQKAEARRRNRRKGGGVSQQCRRRGLNILCEAVEARLISPRLYLLTVG